MTAAVAAALIAAVIYVRISTDREGAGLGVDRQEEDCRTLAARLGYLVREVYVDNDMSASNGKPRPEYLRLLADLQRSGAPTVVLTWHTDRLHRSPLELEEWITAAEPREVVVHTVKAGPIDLATPSGRMVARQLGAVARFESEHKAARIRAKFDQKAAGGQWLGGPVPFGWERVERGRLVLAPEEAALVATGTRALLDGASLRMITQAWAASGVPTRRGAPWHRRTVRHVLERWRNAGVHEHRGEPGGTADWPSIPGVSADDVRAVRELLAERADAAAPVGGWSNRARHLLTGVAVCPCGATVVSGVSDGQNARRLYRCLAPGRGHVARVADPIDAHVLTAVAWRLDQEDAADLLPASTGPAVDVPAMRRERKRLEGRLEDLAVMLAEEELTRAEHRAARGRVQSKLDAVNEALQSASRRSPLAPILAADNPADAFLAAHTDVQRAIIREAATVTIRRGRPGRAPFDPTTVDVDFHEPQRTA